MDGDGATELLFGSLMGKVSIFKVCEHCDQLLLGILEANRAVADCWRSPNAVEKLRGERIRDVHLLGLLLCWRHPDYCGDSRREMLCVPLSGGAEVLQLCSDFNVALNVCDVVHLNNELIVATRDGRVLVYRPNMNHDEVAQMEIDDEIETLIVLRPKADTSPQVLARCFSGEVYSISGLNVEDKREIVSWDGPPRENEGVTFVVGDIELGAEQGMNALVSMNGLVSLFSSSGERQWDFQLPEAVVNADKLEMTASNGDRQDAIVVCTWSGQMYAIQSERRLVRFRMLLPGCSMFCVGIRDFSAHIDPTIVGISTSGTVFVYRDVQETLIRGLQDSTLVWHYTLLSLYVP
ncbi:Glycoside hydrolase protein [Phytophthora nicotianae]|uniref:Glycoside hydrolase protein n=1 Tax=Phytophthora nicotianae TaxID=4792 RepID=A0A0W8BZG4_PHYNI|nr:Glycoside hydrolase protein [Phytophthora nicotianae]